jgi:hypothetical protein
MVLLFARISSFVVPILPAISWQTAKSSFMLKDQALENQLDLTPLSR